MSENPWYIYRLITAVDIASKTGTRFTSQNTWYIYRLIALVDLPAKTRGIFTV